MKAIVRSLLALLMIAVGITHFLDPAAFAAIVPKALPAPFALVYVSGIAEIAGGVGLLIPKTRRWAAWGLIALYIAVFPANVNMAIHHLPLGAEPVPSWALWARLPLQFALIYWAWRYTKAPDAAPRR